jgi:hypothetical protein
MMNREKGELHRKVLQKTLLLSRLLGDAVMFCACCKLWEPVTARRGTRSKAQYASGRRSYK